MKAVRVEVVRSDGRPAMRYTALPGELPELEKNLSADPGVKEWYVSEHEVEPDEGGES